MPNVRLQSYEEKGVSTHAPVSAGMDATFPDDTAPDAWRCMFLAFLWLLVAALFTANLAYPEITLVAFYSIPPLVAAVVLPPRFVLPLVAAGLTCSIVAGLYFGHLKSHDFVFRIVAVAGIGAVTVVLAGVRSRQSAAVEDERARMRATLDSLLDPHVLMRAVRDEGGHITDFVFADANDAACRYNRLPRAGMVGRRLLELLPAHVGTGLLDLYRRTIETGHPLVLDDYLYPHDILEEPRYFDIRGIKVGDALSFTWRDVTERHRAAAALEQRVRTDELTKLLNRRGMFEKLEDLRGKTPRTGRDLAVLFVDFDKFKDVNDTYGHAAGDEVLRAAADRIRACLRHSDDLGARVGGDEMMVVLHGVHGIKDAVGVAEKLRRSAAAPVRYEGTSVVATVSIGVTLARPDESTDALVARADAAMYEAKQRGRNQVITINGSSVS